MSCDPEAERDTRVRRLLRNLIKRHWKRGFELGQRVGVDVLPRHWYSSVPDFRLLRSDDRWREPLEMTGVAGAEPAGQFAFLESLVTPEVRAALEKRGLWRAACEENGEEGYGPGDADALYALAHTKRPGRVIQVGCGVSTAILRRASPTSELICVDPYPTPLLRRLVASKHVTLIESMAEHVAPARLAELRAGDVLFIDSSHTTRPGSDVHHLVLRVLPLLTAGVYVHVHDVHWPYDYSPNIFGPADLFFGSEPALLHAFMIQNPRVAIAMCMSMLHHADPERLGRLLSSYEPFRADRGINPPDRLGQSPSSVWLVTK
jgi:predicted O-methyltransferase YrrM